MIRGVPGIIAWDEKKRNRVYSKGEDAQFTQSCLTLSDPMDCSPPGSSVHGIFPGKKTGMSCYIHLQGIFPTQGLNLQLPHWQVNSLPLSCLVSQLTFAAAAKSLQLCRTLYDPIDGSPAGSPVPGILQARTLEWVAISFSNA